jgi:uncharacterized membrane protein
MSEMIHVLAASYDRLEDARAAYEEIEVAHKHVGHHQQLDVAILNRGPGGELEVLDRRDTETHDRTVEGLGWGLAVGAVTAIFPAVGIFGALAAGGTVGAVMGRLSGHATRALSRDDLKTLGEVLDQGDSGLVVAYGPNMADRVTAAVAGAAGKAYVTTDVTVEQLASDLRSAKASSN